MGFHLSSESSPRPWVWHIQDSKTHGSSKTKHGTSIGKSLNGDEIVTQAPDFVYVKAVQYWAPLLSHKELVFPGFELSCRKHECFVREKNLKEEEREVKILFAVHGLNATRAGSGTGDRTFAILRRGRSLGFGMEVEHWLMIEIEGWVMELRWWSCD